MGHRSALTAIRCGANPHGYRYLARRRPYEVQRFLIYGGHGVERNLSSPVEQEKPMRKFRPRKIPLVAFLFVALVAGCSGLGKRANGGNPLTPPGVTSVTPPEGSTVTSASTKVVTATFSQAMNPE